MKSESSQNLLAVSAIFTVFLLIATIAFKSHLSSQSQPTSSAHATSWSDSHHSDPTTLDAMWEISRH